MAKVRELAKSKFIDGYSSRNDLPIEKRKAASHNHSASKRSLNEDDTQDDMENTITGTYQQND